MAGFPNWLAKVTCLACVGQMPQVGLSCSSVMICNGGTEYDGGPVWLAKRPDASRGIGDVFVAFLTLTSGVPQFHSSSILAEGRTKDARIDP